MTPNIGVLPDPILGSVYKYYKYGHSPILGRLNTQSEGQSIIYFLFPYSALLMGPPGHPDVDPPNPAIAWVTLHIAHALEFILWPLGKRPLKLLYIKNIPSIGISNLGIDQVSIYSRRIYKSKTLDNNNFFCKGYEDACITHM